MSYELKEAQLSDVDEIGAILDKVYAKDPLISQLMPLAHAEKRAVFWAGWLRGDFSKPGEKLFKMAEVSSGTIVAFLKARYPAPKFVGPGGAAIPFPEGSNVELFNHCFANMDTFEDKHMDYEKDYLVHVIGTLPEYHRNGLGSRLLTRFTDDADKAGAKTYLQATEIGANLYPRLGWRDIEEMVTETPNGPIVWRCMMREPCPLRN